MSKPFIMIATPCYGGLVYQGYVESIIQLMVYASNKDFAITLAMNGGDSLITRSRNLLVSKFLELPDATHIMFIDADICFKPEYVHRMLSYDQDVVAGMYPVKNIDWTQMQKGINDKPNMNIDQLSEAGLHFVGTPCRGAEREEQDGFVTGIYAGTGFKLIKRIVFERMMEAYPETKYQVAHLYPKPKVQSQNMYALFDCMIDKMAGIYLSEDYAFCQRWREIGGKIWLDTQSRLTHIGTYKYDGSPVGTASIGS
jgi:hypothetical protein